MKGKSSSVQFLHAAGEYTGLPSGAYDLVSMCLVCHELPRSATKKVFNCHDRYLSLSLLSRCQTGTSFSALNGQWFQTERVPVIVDAVRTSKTMKRSSKLLQHFIALAKNAEACTWPIKLCFDMKCPVRQCQTFGIGCPHWWDKRMWHTNWHQGLGCSETDYWRSSSTSKSRRCPCNYGNGSQEYSFSKHGQERICIHSGKP